MKIDSTSTVKVAPCMIAMSWPNKSFRQIAKSLPLHSGHLSTTWWCSSGLVNSKEE